VHVKKKRARLSASRRAAVLVILVAALAALAAGVYLLVAPDGVPESPAASAAELTDPAEKPAAPATVPRITYAPPVRLVIPKIGVDAAVEKVGLTSRRDMASPSRADTVGWYKFGPRPGNKGSAVIDGHSGYADDREAAFDDLPKLKVGDKLFVKDATGKRLVFVVRKKKLFARNASAAEVFGPTKSRRLNLITCTGPFDVAAGTHSKRLVVFAELQPRDGS
jgi:LPXTG-site transpeptidase (sortase) family protein